MIGVALVHLLCTSSVYRGYIESLNHRSFCFVLYVIFFSFKTVLFSLSIEVEATICTLHENGTTRPKDKLIEYLSALFSIYDQKYIRSWSVDKRAT